MTDEEFMIKLLRMFDRFEGSIFLVIGNQVLIMILMFILIWITGR